jgi:hypothetical protein
LHYAEVDIAGEGHVNIKTERSFIQRWTRDPRIRTYRELAFAPPPVNVAPGAYNKWDGFEVTKTPDPVLYERREEVVSFFLYHT